MRTVEVIANKEVQRLLKDWLGIHVETKTPVQQGADQRNFDLVAHAGNHIFVFAIARTDDVSMLKRAGAHLDAKNIKRAKLGKMERIVPVIIALFMGPKAREFLKSMGQSWMDLSGNADIRGSGLRILIEGVPNRFAKPGRPSTAFSPKSSRLSRVMLMEPEKWWHQVELVDATRLSAGYVSKVVSRLETDGLVVHGDEGQVKPKDPSLLLDAWSQAYDFSRHEIGRYHAVGRSGVEVLRRLATSLEKMRALDWAATGLAAAWQLDEFADFRMVTIYVSQPLLEPEDLGLRAVEGGENVWVVVPRDEGVLDGCQEINGVRCVHPVQVYLDLLAHPERANEAARRLRSLHLGWRS